MIDTIELGNLTVNVVRKNIKNIHLRIYPPAGTVRISAPMRMNLDTIRSFAISKLDWIEKQQQKIRTQIREAPRAYLERESHYLWGKCYLLKLTEIDAPPQLNLDRDLMILQVRPGADPIEKGAIVDDFYRHQLEVRYRH